VKTAGSPLWRSHRHVSQINTHLACFSCLPRSNASLDPRLSPTSSATPPHSLLRDIDVCFVVFSERTDEQAVEDIEHEACNSDVCDHELPLQAVIIRCQQVGVEVVDERRRDVPFACLGTWGDGLLRTLLLTAFSLFRLKTGRVFVLSSYEQSPTEYPVESFELGLTAEGMVRARSLKIGT
jgi:hypothetical protein